MRSGIFSLAALCLVASVSAQEWYAVFTNDHGYAFMDSNNAKIQTTTGTSVGQVSASKDKGKRFRFPTGSGGTVVSQAHNNHAVGYDQNKNEFHADFSTSHLDALVTVTINGNKASFCNNNNNCIGMNGQKTTEKFQWTIQQIAAV